MGLDSRYQIAPSLEMYFVDKDTGLPLTNGQIFFFQDNARTIPKPVFELNGTPPNYTYTPLPNPCILSSVGTFQDGSGNDILPYYFPFDASGNVQLYYIEVYDQNGILQWTRQGWPNFTQSNVETNDDITNFVANGQFLVHNNVPASSANGFIVGKISQTTTNIAQGGWTFERSSNGATDIITFPEYPAITSPTGNPRFSIQINRTNPTSDTRNDLCLAFKGVNTFASSTQEFNLYFEASSATPSTQINNVQILTRKVFGTGGSPSSPDESTPFNIITIPATNTPFNTPILFGTNINKTLGTNNDDYVQIVIRFPVTGTQNVLLTNFALTLNPANLTAFPFENEAQQIDLSTSGYLPNPNPDGSNLYLPIRLTPTGFGFDDSGLAKIVASTIATPAIGELLCDGATYRTNDYSSDGIPYSRLQAKLFNGTVPVYGTGSSFVTATASTAIGQNLILSTNIFGSATAPANGAVSPGFTFTPIHLPAAAGFGVTTNLFGTNKIYVFGTNTGAVTVPTAGTSGFTIVDTRNIAAVITRHIFEIDTIAGGAMAGGTYFTFTSLNPVPTNYYMWFKIDNVGADPAPGGTGIEVDLLSSMSAQDVAVAVAAALDAGRQTWVTCVAANSITSGSYWTFGTTNGNSYYVWYKKDNIGTDPAPGGIGIEVDITSGQSNATVAAETALALNKYYFAVPDLRGMFLRGYDPTVIWDINAPNRFGNIPGIYGNLLNTFELDQFLSHFHPAISANFVNSAAGTEYVNTAGNKGALSGNTGFAGQTETNSVNANVYWMIKY